MTELLCIVCPRGCHLTVDLTAEGLNRVTGNSCPRGAAYGISETTSPTRVVTSTVRIDSEDLARLPVKTSAPIPKARIFDVMSAINQIHVAAPIQLNQVLLPHVLGLDADIVATRSIER